MKWLRVLSVALTVVLAGCSSRSTRVGASSAKPSATSTPHTSPKDLVNVTGAESILIDHVGDYTLVGPPRERNHLGAQLLMSPDLACATDWSFKGFTDSEVDGKVQPTAHLTVTNLRYPATAHYQFAITRLGPALAPLGGNEALADSAGCRPALPQPLPIGSSIRVSRQAALSSSEVVHSYPTPARTSIKLVSRSMLYQARPDLTPHRATSVDSDRPPLTPVWVVVVAVTAVPPGWDPKSPLPTAWAVDAMSDPQRPTVAYIGGEREGWPPWEPTLVDAGAGISVSTQ